MSTAPHRTRRFWTCKRVVALVAALLVVGVLVTPVQWYVAYRGVRQEKQRRAGVVRVTVDAEPRTALGAV